MGKEVGLAAQLSQAASFVGGGAIGAAAQLGGLRLVGGLGGHRGLHAPRQLGVQVGLPAGGSRRQQQQPSQQPHH